MVNHQKIDEFWNIAVIAQDIPIATVSLVNGDIMKVLILFKLFKSQSNRHILFHQRVEETVPSSSSITSDSIIALQRQRYLPSNLLLFI